jgi:hypothetical protein
MITPDKETVIKTEGDTPVSKEGNKFKSTEEALEHVDAIMTSGTEEEKDALHKQLFETQEGLEQPEIKEPVQADEPEKTEESEQEKSSKKIYKVNFHGREIDADDEDGLLGFKTVNYLKRAKIHGDLRIKELKEQENEARIQAAKAHQQLRELQKNYEEIVKKQKEKPVQTEEPPKQIEKPKYPDLPADKELWGEEEYGELEKYNTKYSEYLENIAKSSGVSKDTISSIVEEKIKTIKDDLAQKIKDTEAYLVEVKKQREAEENQKIEDDYWKKIESFQSQSPDAFKTRKPVREIHKELLSFMDRIAYAHGLKKPYDEDSQDYVTYTDKRAALMNGWLEGNKDILIRTQGIDPPEEYETYFKIGEIEKKRKELIEKGELAQNASLRLAYLYDLDSSGELSQNLNDLRFAERNTVLKDLGKAVNDSAQYASTVPNNLTQNNSPLGNGYSEADWKWFSTVQDYTSLNKVERKKYTDMGHALEAIMT